MPLLTPPLAVGNGNAHQPPSQRQRWYAGMLYINLFHSVLLVFLGALVGFGIAQLMHDDPSLLSMLQYDENRYAQDSNDMIALLRPLDQQWLSLEGHLWDITYAQAPSTVYSAEDLLVRYNDLYIETLRVIDETESRIAERLALPELAYNAASAKRGLIAEMIRDLRNHMERNERVARDLNRDLSRTAPAP